MLFKLGPQTVPVKLLDKFPAKENAIQITYDAEKKAFTLQFKKRKRRRGIIIPKGIVTPKVRITEEMLTKSS
ncbi:MAG: hypothetical protein PHH26_00710 [Candidatus Thermoplasmatota archaeon]|nr:hypothetical protein [Candidatus Thermoplasmatota archaeon]